MSSFLSLDVGVVSWPDSAVCNGHGKVRDNICACDAGWSSWTDVYFTEPSMNCYYSDDFDQVRVSVWCVVVVWKCVGDDKESAKERGQTETRP
jgi:hypothetical protein